MNLRWKTQELIRGSTTLPSGSTRSIGLPDDLLQTIGLRLCLSVAPPVCSPALPWALICMGEQLQVGGTASPHRETGEQLGAVNEFSGLFPRLSPALPWMHTDGYARPCTVSR